VAVGIDNAGHNEFARSVDYRGTAWGGQGGAYSGNFSVLDHHVGIFEDAIRDGKDGAVLNVYAAGSRLGRQTSRQADEQQWEEEFSHGYIFSMVRLAE